MDGRGRALDNVFIERLWKSVKYQEIYLRNYETVADVERRIRFGMIALESARHPYGTGPTRGV
jgi:hypothetical protein